MLRLQIDGLGSIVFDGGGLYVTYIVAICLEVRSKPLHVSESKQ